MRGAPDNSPKPWKVTPAQDAPPTTRDLWRGLRQDPGKDIRDERSSTLEDHQGPRLTRRAGPWLEPTSRAGCPRVRESRPLLPGSFPERTADFVARGC